MPAFCLLKNMDASAFTISANTLSTKCPAFRHAHGEFTLDYEAIIMKRYRAVVTSNGLPCRRARLSGRHA